MRLLSALVLLSLLILADLYISQPAPLRESPSPDSGLIALTGRTMGTEYRILVPQMSFTGAPSRQSLVADIDAKLYRLDKTLMSTYESRSELSQLNALPVNHGMNLSPELLVVIQFASQVYRLSGGAFDITIKPLVDLWGFGNVDSGAELPEDQAITRARAQLGMEKLQIDPQTSRVTKTAPVSLDLSAIAKGYAVDAVAALLDDHGLANYLVEIGGEVTIRGNRPDGTPWRLGIEAPASGTSTLFQAIRTGHARLSLAGSGGYRNFFVHDGRRYSHTIDPHSGHPVAHDLASVTVVAPTTMQADAWATALLVLGPEAGMKRANDLQLPAYFIEVGAGGYKTSHSEAFNQYLPDNQ